MTNDIFKDVYYPKFHLNTENDSVIKSFDLNVNQVINVGDKLIELISSIKTDDFISAKDFYRDNQLLLDYPYMVK